MVRFLTSSNSYDLSKMTTDRCKILNLRSSKEFQELGWFRPEKRELQKERFRGKGGTQKNVLVPEHGVWKTLRAVDGKNGRG